MVVVKEKERNDEWICSKCTLSNSKSENRCNACLSQKEPPSDRQLCHTNTTKPFAIDLTGESDSDGGDDDIQIIIPASTLSARKRRAMAQCQVQEPPLHNNVAQTKGTVQRTLFGNTTVASSKGREKKRTSTDVTKKRKRNGEEFATDSKIYNSSSDTIQSSKDTMFKDTKCDNTNDFNAKGKEIQIQNPTSGSSNFNYIHLHNKAMKTLSSTFGISSLRNLQPKAVECALHGQSQIIVMATGGGKSLCYQLPAVVLPGISIVVCPLIALMIDQVDSLKRKGIEAAFISSSQSEKENQLVIERLQGITSKSQADKGKLNFAPPVHKPIKLLYCTPELLQTNRFRNILTTLYQHNKLSLLAIDEAHCVSTWGSDFRPAYRNLSWLRDAFPALPCMACTATATKKVIDDIRSVLRMTNGEVCHKSTFNRENIHYEVRYKESFGGDDLALKDVMKIVKLQHTKADRNNTPCSGIIYVHKRQDTAHIASMLTSIGIPAASYHAGLTKKQRNETQMNWTAGNIKVAIATVAFGMGIDLAHVRYVIHWSMSKSIEAFYQESGRAGRDGLEAKSILYFSNDEASKYAFLIRKAAEDKAKKSKNPMQQADDRNLDDLQKMVDYCMMQCCRRQFLLKHFGEDIDPKIICHKTCDYCINPSNVIKAQEASSVSRAVRDVKYQSFRQFAPTEYMHHCDSEDDDFEDRGPLYDTDLALTSSDSRALNDIQTVSHTKKEYNVGFSSAKSVLDKLEANEYRQGNGFVKFQSKKTMKQNTLFQALKNTNDGEDTTRKNVKSSTVTVPSHLFDAAQARISKIENERVPAHQSTSVSVSQERQRIQDDIDAIRRRKEELLSKRQTVVDK